MTPKTKKTVKRKKVSRKQVNVIKWSKGKLIILDQRKIPGKISYLKPVRVDQVANAIETLAVRGAPLIRVCAAYGILLGLKPLINKSRRAIDLRPCVESTYHTLLNTRPTAVNLSWALNRMMRTFNSIKPELSSQKTFNILQREALEIHREDKHLCSLIGRYGAKLLPQKATVITHCNAGALATGGIGTALGVVYEAARSGKKINVIADETRPLLQGARLTTFELINNKIDATLMTDGMSASFLSTQGADAVIVGADRIAGNGDVANKIGTFTLAINAHYHNVPFYVAAPSSTFDLSIRSGKEIPIEQRDSDEITGRGAARSAPEGTKVYNPAFDVTPARLITAIITDKGIIRPVNSMEVKRIIGGKR